MLQKFDVIGIHVKIDQALHAYLEQKLRSMDRYVPKHERTAAHLEVRLYEQRQDNHKLPTCEAILRLPGETFALTETGVTPYAAVDIVKAKLKLDLSHYRGEYPDGKQRRHLSGRLRDRLGSIILG